MVSLSLCVYIKFWKLKRTIEYCMWLSFNSHFRHNLQPRQMQIKTKNGNCCFGFSVCRLCLRSCSVNPYTKVLMNGNSSISRVSVQIFSFVNLNVIYLHCQVQICAEIGSDTCVPVSTSRLKIMESTRETLKKSFWTVEKKGFSPLSSSHSFFFLQDCRQRTARSFTTLGNGFGSAGPLMRSDDGEYFHTE